MTFTYQIAQVRRRIAAQLSCFRRTRHNLTVKARRAFYTSFIQSVVEYGSNAYVHTLRKHQYDQRINTSKRAQRIVFGYPARAPTGPIRERFSLAPLDMRFSLKLYIFIFRCLRGLTSNLLNDVFIFRSAAAHTDRITRGQTTQSLSLPAARSRYGCMSLSYLGVGKWNHLPANIRTLAHKHQFIPQLKLWLGYPVKRPTSVGLP